MKISPKTMEAVLSLIAQRIFSPVSVRQLAGEVGVVAFHELAAAAESELAARVEKEAKKNGKKAEGKPEGKPEGEGEGEGEGGGEGEGEGEGGEK